ncbi:hypothetical protein [Hyphomicrobium sp. D-2]|uniref:hypothetical protein n=1 Tax=Hyphomicrobium sp. D-2 TaxID=3041621 RepID=UPI00245541F3|nr:hypothetical protein [Hyphomicrobium sp. D-2]MDH4981241.1 hypothetical protein [Hyphomicrobium sp. D-2]
MQLHDETRSDKPPKLRKRRRTKIELPTVATLDMRTRAGRLYRDTREAIISDLGGRDQLSRAELELVERVAGLSTRLNAADAELLSGETQSLAPGEYATLANSLGRILTILGLQRRQRDVTPTLRAYIDAKSHQGARAA